MLAGDRVFLEIDSFGVQPFSNDEATTWPVPVDRRLDQLLELATDVGERTTRKELLAAIVVAFDPTTDLGELLRRYRLARVRDVLVHDPTGTDDDGVIEFPLNRPGPRRIASAGGDDDG